MQLFLLDFLRRHSQFGDDLPFKWLYRLLLPRIERTLVHCLRHIGVTRGQVVGSDALDLGFGPLFFVSLLEIDAEQVQIVVFLVKGRVDVHHVLGWLVREIGPLVCLCRLFLLGKETLLRVSIPV